MNQAGQAEEKALKAALHDLQKKMDAVEEKYFLEGEMPKETYEKLVGKLGAEKQKIVSALQNTAIASSNLENHLEQVVTFSMKLATVWASSPVKQKEKL